MSDCVVTVPKNFTHPASPGKHGLAAWIGEGDPAGSTWSGQEWSFTTYGGRPQCAPGDRLYIVCEGRLRGYAPIVRIKYEGGRVAFIRRGGAVAVTIDEHVKGFRGWRYRWWNLAVELPFPDWQGLLLQVDEQGRPSYLWDPTR